MRKQWRCFHCDELFRSAREARIHFGGGPYEEAGCVLKNYEVGLLAIIREQAEQLERYRAEDSDLLRVIAGMEVDHRQALQREEERGYARGMRDVQAERSARPGNCTLWPGCGCMTQSGPHKCEGEPI